MLYHFELQMAGVVLLTAMAAGGISLWIKRRRSREEENNQDMPDANSDVI